jgi:hypothetical protein
MPRPYMNVTETRAIEEFRKKVEGEEGVLSIEKPEPPDILIHTGTGRIIWAEITSVFRTNELAEFLNKNGLYNFNGSHAILSEHFDSHSAYISQIHEKINERILSKDSKESYVEIVKKYDKGSLILYIDDPLFSNRDFESLLSRKTSFLPNLEKFSSLYLYIPITYNIGFGEKEIKKMDGLYLLE